MQEPTQLVTRFASQEEEDKAIEKIDKAMEEARRLTKEDSAQNAQQPVQLVQRVENPQASVEKRKFLILFVGFDENDEEYKDWKVCVGRQDCYDTITLMMESYDIDLIESKIIAETESPNKAKSLYTYMSFLIEKELIPLKDGEFYPDLDDYIDGDIEDYELEDGIN